MTAKQALLRVWRISITAAIAVIAILLWEQRGNSSSAVPVVGAQASLPTLAPMLKSAMPAVVNIATVTIDEQAVAPRRRPSMFQMLYDYYDQPAASETYGLGSGVIINAEQGYVITSFHVVQDADHISVTLSDDREFPARILGADPDTDIAVLQINPNNLTEMPLADSDQIEVGDFVVAIGNPFGLEHSVSLGIVSAKGRFGIGSGIENLIQTDAPINEGNSGGALVNTEGKLVGMSTLIYANGNGGNTGIGFAIPANMTGNIVSQLIEHGAVQRTLFGVTVLPLNNELRAKYSLSEDLEGAIVTEVDDQSVAQNTGIQTGDILIKINGRHIGTAKALRNSVGLLLAGDAFTVELLRDQQVLNFNAQLPAPQPSEMPGDALHPLLLGAEFSETLPTGVEIVDITHGTPAWRAQLRPGDTILEVNTQPVNSLMALKDALTSAPPTIQLLVQSGSQVYNVTIE